MLGVTGDILLADRALKTGATVLAQRGKPFDAGSIGGAAATREIMADLRAGMDGVLGGSGGVPQGRPLAVPAGAGPGVGKVGSGDVGNVSRCALKRQMGFV
jgi:hypothetical protein